MATLVDERLDDRADALDELPVAAARRAQRRVRHPIASPPAAKHAPIDRSAATTNARFIAPIVLQEPRLGSGPESRIRPTLRATRRGWSGPYVRDMQRERRGGLLVAGVVGSSIAAALVLAIGGQAAPPVPPPGHHLPGGAPGAPNPGRRGA